MSKISKKHIENAIKQIEDWNKGLGSLQRKGKYKKMARTPYYFYRGTNHLFWNYFANDKRLQKFSLKNSKTWIQADLHAYNYGIYCNNKGDLVYDLNDFDEACMANFQFDLWRMAASMVLIARENELFERTDIVLFLNAFSMAYVDQLENYLNKGKDALYQVTKKNAYGKLDETIEQIEKEESRKEMLEQWTTEKDGELVFDLNYKKLNAIEEEKNNEIRQAMPAYLETLQDYAHFDSDYFKVLDVAQRISSGTGSYGTPRYYILIKGEAEGKYEQRILDAKLQYKPSPYQFMDDKFRQNYDEFFENEGQRHKEAYLALNSYTDKYLGWMQLPEGVFSVRERSPYKGYLETKVLNTDTRFRKIAEQWGFILASAHIRASKDFDVESIVQRLKEHKPVFNSLVEELAFEYAEYSNAVYKDFLNLLFLDE